MNRILSKFLLLFIFFNSVFSNFYYKNVFAFSAENTKIKYSWNENLTLNNQLNFIDRREHSDEVLLTWDFSKQNGISVDKGVYLLSYFISDNKKIDFKVEKNAETAVVTYSVNSKNDVTKDKPFNVFKPEDNMYKEANKKNFPVLDEQFKINFGSDDSAKSVSFTISKNKGFNFKYEGNTIKFIWKGDLFYFVTNGVGEGTIYDFNMSLDKTVVNENLKVFLGINSATFDSKPIANGGKTLIDHSSRPLTEYPGENAGVIITFDMIKELDTTDNTYKYIKLSDANINQKATEIIINLSTQDINNSLQVRIPNIYGSFTPIDLGSGRNATISRNATNDKLQIEINGLQQGIIYNPVIVSAERTTTNSNFKFLTIPVSMSAGSVYTYPKYSIMSLGDSEFYLKVEPFKNYNGYYTIYQGFTQGTLQKWAEYEEKKNGKEDFIIAVNLNALSTAEKFFRIDFSFAPNENLPTDIKIFPSQVLKYRAYESDINLTVPQNLEVLSSKIYRNQLSDGTLKDELNLTLKWDISYESILKNMIKNNGDKPINIKYSFYESLSPNSEQEEFAAINLEVSKVNDNIAIEYSGTSGNNGIDYSNIYIENSGATTQRIETLAGKERIIKEATVTFKINVSEKNSENKSQIQYPGIYFISNKAKYSMTVSSDEKEFSTDYSNNTVLTLNDLINTKVLRPQDINIVENTVTPKSFEVKFKTLTYTKSGDPLFEYVNYLKEQNLSLNNKSIMYNFYITQDKNNIDELIKFDRDRPNLPTYIKDKIKLFDYEGKDLNESVLNLKESTFADGTSILENLRMNNIVKIENMMQNINKENQNLIITETDENQQYYIIVETVAYPVNELDEVVQDKIDNSEYTNILIVTTLPNSTLPSEEEKSPQAPTNFQSSEVTLNSTNLDWDKVIEVPEKDSKSKLEYQFIKIRGKKLEDKILNLKKSYKDVWNLINISSGKDGFKTLDGKIYEYNQSENSFSNVEADRERYVYTKLIGSKSSILDKTLSPNQIYFYYIRTVRIVEGEDVAYSVWVPLSVTTANIESPKNLKIDRSGDYDKKTEAIINFDIPKINMDLLGTEYDILYSVKKDLNQWQDNKVMAKSEITFRDNSDGKTINVTYKIRGLEPGNMYSFRVRLNNKVLNTYSSYSNQVDYRTDSNVIDNDYDQDTDDFEKHFKDIIDKIKSESFWFLKDDTSTTQVVYRQDYFENIINTTSIINLVEGKGAAKEYYIPANIILKAFDQNKGFKISYKNSDVIFSPKSINPEQNEAIKTLNQKKSSEKILDYYVKLTAFYKEGKYNINGFENLTPVIEVYFEVIATKEKTISIEQTLINYIDELLKTPEFSQDVKDKIRELLTKKDDYQTILKEIDKFVDKFKEKFSKKLQEEISKNKKKTYNTNLLNGNIIITSENKQGYSIAPYKFSLGSWVKLTPSEYANKKALYTNEIGSYVFTFEKFIINGIGNIKNGNVITNIVTKYGLGDYLGKTGNINLSSSITKYMLVGSLARIAGAKNTDDPSAFLKSKGITFNNRAINANISTQEAIYLTMKVYELKSGSKLNSIRVNNYSKTSSIKGINNTYKKAIQVAFDKGIYNNLNMNPNGVISVQEFLQMLASLSSLVKI